MARVQLVVPDADHVRFVRQARREGMTLSAWLRSAVDDRLERAAGSVRIRTPADLAGFSPDVMPWRDRTWNRIGKSISR